MAAPNFANTQMVVGVNHKLKKWWENIKRECTTEVDELLRGLTFLIDVAPDRYLIKALLKFWDPARAVFKFCDCEMTPTIEEISGFTELPYQGKRMITPHRLTPKKFLKNMGLKYNPKLACLNFEYIPFEFLYARFGHREAHKELNNEFSCSAAKWETYHVNAFVVALLGCLVFPREDRNIDTRLSYVVKTMAKGGTTLVPMIVAEIMGALSKCVLGKKFFEGCKFLLQLWAVEHFYRRPNIWDSLDGLGNKIHTNPKRTAYFIAPVGTEDWFVFLSELYGCHAQWKYSWLCFQHAMVRGDELYYIELIGLKGVQPYAPLRGLRKFGQIQMIPLRSNMSLSEYEFETKIPELHNICRRWERLLTISLQENRPYCTPEYYVWILEDADRVDLDRGGSPGFEDLEERTWARNLLNRDYNVTPEMKEQIVPTYASLYH